MANAHALADLPAPPDIVERPALAQFLWYRGIEYRDAAGPIGKSHEAVRRFCLPFSDPRRIAPDQKTRVRIAVWTRGHVPPESFDPPEPPNPTVSP